jgi:hypothetical protein
MLVLVTVGLNDPEAKNIIDAVQEKGLNYIVLFESDNVDYQENAVSILNRCDALVSTGDSSLDSTLCNWALDNGMPFYHFPDLPEAFYFERKNPNKAEQCMIALMESYRDWVADQESTIKVQVGHPL